MITCISSEINYTQPTRSSLYRCVSGLCGVRIWIVRLKGGFTWKTDSFVDVCFTAVWQLSHSVCESFLYIRRMYILHNVRNVTSVLYALYILSENTRAQRYTGTFVCKFYNLRGGRKRRHSCGCVPFLARLYSEKRRNFPRQR